ncbi:MAG: SDR family NAD(P)-dependent oxidoreductase [Candidatus Omnitrophota bacterium]|jgi:dTDP-glucose 4,6-dehydratase|nr:MAG: SDR family NAD(P)-dependent oxidoreductase [Candidatus Omnitrophota bacterium]
MFKWKDKKVLVTGAGGFIGSHLTERLLSLGAFVRAFVEYNPHGDAGHINHLLVNKSKRLEIFYGDIKEMETVRKAVDHNEVIFNLAALVGIPYSYEHPQEVVDTNTLGTLNILIAARENKICKIVQTSTSEVYGTALYVPIDEKHPLQAQSPYSASKIAADALALSFYCSYGLPVSIIRPFNCFGPRQSLRAVIPTIIAQALKNRVICLGNIAPKRDFTYVADTVSGFIRVAESPKSTGEIINIGTSRSVSIGQLAKIIAGLIGKDVDIRHEKMRIRPKKSEVMCLCADNKKARKLLGWRPQISLEEGLRLTIEYVASHQHQYNRKGYAI